METQKGNQRWRDRTTSFRPANECIQTQHYDVEPIATDTIAKDFVVRHHYSASYPAARFRFGLFRGDVLQGVAVFSHPVNDRTLTSVFPGNPLDSVELGRFVLLDEVPGNGESWMLARCLALLRKIGIRGVVSFSDPVPRSNSNGELLFRGHIGTIYQATNAAYLGRGTSRRLRILPDGTVFNDRSIQKIRSGERGWEYAAAILEKQGSEPCPKQERREWLAKWLPVLTRQVHHGGNHKYAWGLARPLQAQLPYPKQTDAQ